MAYTYTQTTQELQANHDKVSADIRVYGEFKGEYAIGSVFTLESDYYIYDDGTSSNYFTANDGVTLPYTATEADPNDDVNLAIAVNASAGYVNNTEERLLGVGLSLYKGSSGSYVQNDDTVPVGTTHLTVLINGKAEDVRLSSSASGVVADLTETGATVGGVGVTLHRFLNGGYQATDAELSTITPLVGEQWFNTTDNGIHIGDGSTTGGFKVAQVKSVDNVSQLKARNFKPGDLVETLGYYTKGDGGGAMYLFDADPITYEGINHTGVSGVARLLLNSYTLSPKIAGARCNEVDDDALYINNLSVFLGASGGGVIDCIGLNVLVDTALTIEKNVTILGGFNIVGNNGENNLGIDYLSMSSHLIVNPAITITLKACGSIQGLLITRKGMSIPEDPSANFTGLAITNGGEDTEVSDCLILGFNKAYYSTGYQRPRIINVQGDCLNGVDIQNCGDIARVENCHFWPFVTVSDSAAYPLTRPGTAYSFSAFNDWLKSVNNFSYGYSRGTVIDDANSIELTNVSHDGTQTLVGSIGIEITGTSEDIVLNQPQVAAQKTGIRIALDSNTRVFINNPVLWFNNDNSMLFEGYEVVKISGGGTIRNSTNGIVSTVSTNEIDIDDLAIKDIVNPFLNNSNCLMRIGQNIKLIDYAANYGSIYTGGDNFTTTPVADPIQWKQSVPVLLITGTGSFGTARTGYPGEEVVFFADGGTITISHGGSFFNQSGANVALQSGLSAKYKYIKGAWRQIG